MNCLMHQLQGAPVLRMASIALDADMAVSALRVFAPFHITIPANLPQLGWSQHIVYHGTLPLIDRLFLRHGRSGRT